MRERVVIKWGGGLITQKDRMKSVRSEIIDHLATNSKVVCPQGSMWCSFTAQAHSAI